jgi:hypothetical protein
MAKKKNVTIEEIKARINSTLLHSVDDVKEHRIGLCLFLEKLLHDTGNYKGYSYLNNHDMATSRYGRTPGIVYGENKAEHKCHDPSRRQYF